MDVADAGVVGAMAELRSEVVFYRCDLQLANGNPARAVRHTDKTTACQVA
jgi:hypothetical protein